MAYECKPGVSGGEWGHDITADVSDVSLDAAQREDHPPLPLPPPPSTPPPQGSDAPATAPLPAPFLPIEESQTSSVATSTTCSHAESHRRVGSPSEIDNIELNNRYDPESMRHLDVDKTLEAIMASAQESVGPRGGGASRRRGGGQRASCGLSKICVLTVALGGVALAAVFGVTRLENPPAFVQGMRGGPILIDPRPNHALVDRTADCDEGGGSVLSREGREACERACLSATCCHEPPGDKISCVAKNAKLCRRYDDVCGILETLPEPDRAVGMDEVPTAPPNLDELCNSANVRTAAGYVACEEACHPSRCCKFRDTVHEKHGLENCYAGNEESCSQYSRSCHVLPGFDSDLTYEKEMEKVHETIKKDHHADTSKALEEEETAQEPVTTMSEGRTESSKNDEKDIEIIADVCSERSLKTAVGRESCSEMCESHLCCFEGGAEADSCAELATCVMFSPCRIVSFGALDEDIDMEEGILYSRAFISAVCSETSLAETMGVSDCHTVCDAHMCCFVDNPSDCPAKRSEKCDVFESCRALLTP